MATIFNKYSTNKVTTLRQKTVTETTIEPAARLRAWLSKILDHFVTNNLFHPNHHGALENHSTATALIQLTGMWMEASERKNLSGISMIDQSAAYDLLSHSHFTEKLKLYNFDEASVNWCKSYLGGRSQ